jgi:hypothetical protein
MKIKTESSKGVDRKVTVTSPAKKIGTMAQPVKIPAGWPTKPKKNC